MFAMVNEIIYENSQIRPAYRQMQAAGEIRPSSEMRICRR